MNNKHHPKLFITTILLLVFLFSISACSSGVPGTTPPEDAVTRQTEVSALQTQVQQLQADLSKEAGERAALTQALSQKETELATFSQTVAQLEEALAKAETATAPPQGPGNPTTASTASLVQTGMTVVQLLANTDMTALSAHVHPTLGVRFTPYPYVNTATDVVLSSAQVATAISVPVQNNWGAEDGTGDPLLMDYATYHARYVYDEDYANPEVIGIDAVIGYGNTIDNLSAVYPNARFLDFHFNGIDPQYDGMDWRSLRLVFELDNGDWKLVGIVHGEWTI